MNRDESANFQLRFCRCTQLPPATPLAASRARVCGVRQRSWSCLLSRRARAAAKAVGDNELGAVECRILQPLTTTKTHKRGYHFVIGDPAPLLAHGPLMPEREREAAAETFHSAVSCAGGERAASIRSRQCVGL